MQPSLIRKGQNCQKTMKMKNKTMKKDNSSTKVILIKKRSISSSISKKLNWIIESPLFC